MSAKLTPGPLMGSVSQPPHFARRSGTKSAVLFEQIRVPAEQSFACLNWCGPAFVCPYHIHPEVELNHIISSTGRRLVGDHLGEFAPGDLVLLGPGLPHMYFHETGTDHGPRWAQSRYVQFRSDCLGAGFFDLPEMSKVRTLLQRARRGLSFPRQAVTNLLPRLDALFAATGAQRISLLLDLLGRMGDIRSATPLASVGFEPITDYGGSARLNLATAFIQEHLTEDITLEQVSRVVHMSPQGFSRFFQRYMGRSFVSYVCELRVGRACRLLLETDQTVSQVCWACGFTNLSNFNRRFRMLKGLAPREYRRGSKPIET